MRSRLFLVALVAAVLGCAAGGGAPGRFGGGAWGGASEDRVFVGSFSEILGLAVSQRYLYVAGLSGVAVLDRQFQRWLPPLPLDLARGFARSVVMAADPTDDAVWIGLDGGVLRYRPLFGDATRTLVPGTPDIILFDRRDPTGGALVRSGGGWNRITSSGFAVAVSPDQLPPPDARILAPSAEEVYRAYPSLRAFGGLMTRDASLQSYPVTAAAAAPDRSEVYLGTFGNGIFQVDPVFNRVTHLEYGLLSGGARALALASDGVWVAGSGNASAMASSRGGITFVGDDLDEWRWVTDDQSRALARASAYDIAVRDGAAWIGTDRGLVRLETRGGGMTRSWSALHGLPDDRVLSVAPRADGSWAGTARGLAFVPWVGDGRNDGEAGDGVVLLPSTPVRALLARGDSLWIGSDVGLLLYTGGALAPGAAAAPSSDPRRISGDSRVTRAIVALAAADSAIFAATETDVVLVSGATPRTASLAAVDFGRVSPITALAADSRTLWVGGRRGVLAVDRATGATRLIAGGTELSGEVTDLALGNAVAWVGTREGVLRVRRLDDGLPR